MPQFLRLDTAQKRAEICFWLSGFTALVLETVWAKEACLLFGNTSFAYATVVGAFMTGLALGSFWFGNRMDRKPIAEFPLYGRLELGIAACAVLFPAALGLLKPIYVKLYPALQSHPSALAATRLVLSGIILLVPTFLMGGTFPVLSKWLSRQPGNLQTAQSRLYAFNLFGATAGAFAAGFFLIPAWGLRASALIAAGINVGIFGLALLWSRPSGAASPTPEPVRQSNFPRLSGADIAVLALIVWHGFAAFTAQMMWTRLLVLVFGSSTYAFSSILTVYLLGLGIGSWLVGQMVKKSGGVSGFHIGWSALAFAAATALLFPALEWIVYLFILCTPWFAGGAAVIFVWQFVFAVAALLVPASLMGAVYPLVLGYWTQKGSAGRSTGLTYALNTAGGVAGALASVFVLVPLFGVVNTLKGSAFFTAAFGLLLIIFTAPRRDFRRHAIASVSALLLLLLPLFYPWDKNLFTSGAFVYGPIYTKAAEQGKEVLKESLRIRNPLIFYREGVSTVVSVTQHQDSEEPGSITKSLRVNGKTDASTSGDMATQLYLAYLPLFAHANPESVLVIGLGSGVTIGSALEFDSVKQLRFVEIEPAVIAANRYFAAENHYALADPRVVPTIGDGRNHLAYGSESYDVIISEPSNPWIAGVSSLFTVENYRSALSRMKPGGVFCQWFHAYQMPVRDFVMVCRSFASVFPEVNLFQVSAGDYILLGSSGPIEFDRTRIERMIKKKPAVFSDLTAFTDHQAGFLEGTFLFSNRDFRSAIDRVPTPLNTDDRLALEYDAPKYLHTETTRQVENWVYSIAKKDFLPAYTEGSIQPDTERNLLISEFQYASGVKALAAKQPEVALRYFRNAMMMGAKDAFLFEAMGEAHELAGRFRAARGYYQRTQTSPLWEEKTKYLDERAALRYQMRLNPLMTRDARNHRMIANLSFRAQDIAGALDALDRAVSVNPLDPKNFTDLAMLMTFTGDTESADTFLSKAESLAPGNTDVLRARQLFEGLIRKEDFQTHLQRILFHLEGNEYSAALKATQKAIQKFPNHPVLLELKSRIEQKMGRSQAAAASSRKAADLRARLVADKT